MPEAAAGSSGKSFLQRARGKVLRWLRRSLRTTHQVNVSSEIVLVSVSDHSFANPLVIRRLPKDRDRK